MEKLVRNEWEYLHFIIDCTFAGDSGELLYGPGNLLDKDVIFVSMNYRLGIFGFLTLGDDALPGNLGKIYH